MSIVVSQFVFRIDNAGHARPMISCMRIPHKNRRTSLYLIAGRNTEAMKARHLSKTRTAQEGRLHNQKADVILDLWWHERHFALPGFSGLVTAD